MKLQKHTSRQIGETEYSKWVVVVPPPQIEELGWEEGEELESEVKGKALIVKQLTTKPKKPEKIPYEKFRDQIAELLKAEPHGLSWTEIKEKLKLPQKVPNNMWVRMMEIDISLTRELDAKTGKTIWRLKFEKK